jgi:hypothetical protein
VHKGSQRTQRAQRIIQYHKAIPFPNHTLYSREDPRLFVIISSAVMIVVHFINVSALYPWLVISLPVGDLRTSFLPFFILPLVYGLAITTCCYKGQLQEYVMLCYGFPTKRFPLAVLRFPAQTSPLAPCGSGRSQSMSHAWHKTWCPSPLNRARHTTYSSPN